MKRSLKKMFGGVKCQHGRHKSSCPICNPLRYCIHGTEKTKCKKGCGGGSLCQHGVLKSQCTQCAREGVRVAGICPHSILKKNCSVCTPSIKCIHGHFKRYCGTCIKLKKEKDTLADDTIHAATEHGHGSAAAAVAPPPQAADWGAFSRDHDDLIVNGYGDDDWDGRVHGHGHGYDYGDDDWDAYAAQGTAAASRGVEAFMDDEEDFLEKRGLLGGSKRGMKPRPRPRPRPRQQNDTKKVKTKRTKRTKRSRKNK